MRLIDANSGREVRVGVPFTNINGRLVIDEIEEGIFNARARYRVLQPASLLPLTNDEGWTPLHVRYTHPSFLFEKVAFIPS